jgi:hypothetical protein
MQDTYFDAIESYLLGYLSADKKAAFEAEIAANPALAQAVEQQRTEHAAMQQLRREAMRAKMRTWQAGGAETTATTSTATLSEAERQAGTPLKITWSRTRFIQMAVAACFALLGAWFFLRPEVSTGDNFAIANNLYPGWPENMRDVNTPADPLDAAVDALKKQNAAGLSLLDQVPADHPLYATIPLLKSDFYFRQKQYDQAMALSRQTANTAMDKNIREGAEWRLALALLAKNGPDATEFKTVFDSILRAGEAHFHHKDAVKLQQQLKK